MSLESQVPAGQAGPLGSPGLPGPQVGRAQRQRRGKKSRKPAQGPRSILRQCVHFQVLCFHSNSRSSPSQPYCFRL